MASVLDEPGVEVARFSVARYHQLIASGVLDEDDQFELLEGVLVEKMTEARSHAFRLSMIARLLAVELGMGDWMVRAQHPITTLDSEPEPDLAIVRVARYDDRHPTADDIASVIEVADSSLLRDRGTKARIYARAGVPRYVIVNLSSGAVEVHTEPLSGPEPRYANAVTVTSGEVDLGPLTVDVGALIDPSN
jgi:Putative restriction endonuclease